MIEVLERMYVQFDYVRSLVVDAYGAVLNVLASVSSVVCVYLSHRSLSGLRRLAYAFKALLSAASQAGQHLVLVRSHEPVLRLSVTLVAVWSGRCSNEPRRRVSARGRHSVCSVITFGSVALVVHSFASMAADVPLDLVRHFPEHTDHLLRSNLVRLELCWLNDW